MKKLTLSAFVLLLSGMGVAHAQTGKYTQEETNKIPQYSSIEQVRCPSAKFNSVKKRLECKEKIRIELYGRPQTKQENAAENETPDTPNNYGDHGHAH